MKIFVDVETTGFDYWRDSVIELATIITDDAGEEVGTFREYCRPDSVGKNKYHWSRDAEKVHGIPYDFAVKQQHPIHLSVNWINFLSKYIKKQTPLSMFVSTQAFDLRMITALLSKNIGHHYFKMYKYVKHNDYENVADIVPDSYERSKKQRNLEYIAKDLGLKHKAHDALSDTRVTIELWKRFGGMKHVS